MAIPGSPADPGLPAPSGGPPALSAQVGSKGAGCSARGRLTWAMPAPISPPPMTATCLMTIFFAVAEAVDEEDTLRTNCLVTKAMVLRATRSGPGVHTRRRRDCDAPTATGPLGAETRWPRLPALPGRYRDVTGGGAGPRGPLSSLAEAVGTAFQRRSAASTWAGAGHRLPPRSWGLSAAEPGVGPRVAAGQGG